MKWVLIDLSYLAHRARGSFGDLSNDDIPTGVLYGFFAQLLTLCKSPIISSNRVLIFTDSKKSYRKLAYPKYKEHRGECDNPEEVEKLQILYDQINKLKNTILPKLGFPVYKQVGLESDDLIAWTSNWLRKQDQDGVIISSDRDLWQCINRNVHWYDPIKKLYLNKQDFIELKGIVPSLWGRAKSLMGCPGDGVPGLKGIGEKTALKYLTGEHDSLGKKLQVIEDNPGEINKWADLVMLPHKKTKPMKIKEPEYNIKKFFSFCKHYGIKSYLDEAKKQKWIDFFKGNFKGTLRKRKSLI